MQKWRRGADTGMPLSPSEFGEVIDNCIRLLRGLEDKQVDEILKDKADGQEGESLFIPKYGIGEEVWNLYGDDLAKTRVVGYKPDGEGGKKPYLNVEYETGCYTGYEISEERIYPSKASLIAHLMGMSGDEWRLYKEQEE